MLLRPWLSCACLASTLKCTSMQHQSCSMTVVLYVTSLAQINSCPFGRVQCIKVLLSTVSLCTLCQRAMLQADSRTWSNTGPYARLCHVASPELPPTAPTTNKMLWCAALHHACQAGHIDVAAKLIIAGSPVQAADAHGRTPAHLAARRGSHEIVDKLLMAGYEVDALGGDCGHAPLEPAHPAAAEGGGASVTGCAVLHLAARHGHLVVRPWLPGARPWDCMGGVLSMQHMRPVSWCSPEGA